MLVCMGGGLLFVLFATGHFKLHRDFNHRRWQYRSDGNGICHNGWADRVAYFKGERSAASPCNGTMLRLLGDGTYNRLIDEFGFDTVLFESGHW